MAYARTKNQAQKQVRILLQVFVVPGKSKKVWHRLFAQIATADANQPRKTIWSQQTPPMPQKLPGGHLITDFYLLKRTVLLVGCPALLRDFVLLPEC